MYWLFHTALEREFQPVGEFGTYTVLVRRDQLGARPSPSEAAVENRGGPG